ncbi:MAG: hypothetical protein HY228_00070 [Candidatus Yonathbacteria bacterium]|nr:hypothetical protein [Candidatus Yonathbacteria bacterium]
MCELDSQKWRKKRNELRRRDEEERIKKAAQVRREGGATDTPSASFPDGDPSRSE